MFQKINFYQLLKHVKSHIIKKQISDFNKQTTNKFDRINFTMTGRHKST